MTEQETDLRDPRGLQQRWAGVGARFHIQDLWLYVAATVLVALLFVAAYRLPGGVAATLGT